MIGLVVKRAVKVVEVLHSTQVDALAKLSLDMAAVSLVVVDALLAVDSVVVVHVLEDVAVLSLFATVNGPLIRISCLEARATVLAIVLFDARHILNLVRVYVEQLGLQLFGHVVFHELFGHWAADLVQYLYLPR